MAQDWDRSKAYILVHKLRVTQHDSGARACNGTDGRRACSTSTDETVQVVNLISEERIQQRTVDEMVEVTVPHIQVRIVDTITRERVPEGTVKLIFGVSVSQSMGS